MGEFDALFSEFTAGDRLYIPGSSAEPRPFVEALSRYASQLPALEVTHSFLPGINTVPLAKDGNGISEVALFPRNTDAPSAAISVLPTSYYGAQKYLAQQSYDCVYVHVAPPDTDGLCSMGTSVEFSPATMKRARRVIGFINQSMPTLPGAQKIPIATFDTTFNVNWKLVSYDPGPPDQTSKRIARWLSELVDDGAVLQAGLGRVPASLLEQLTGKRALRLYSGLLTEGVRTLSDAGALSETDTHVGCTVLGSQAFYDWLAQYPHLSLCGVEHSHHPGTLAQLDNFTAVNSALEVDLLGQANLESIHGRSVSGIGGAPDFCRGARYSTGGKSIIALPATASSGTVSRIVVDFPPGQPVSLGRNDIDYVVTEFGVATVGDKTAEARARALIDIAAPQFREQLSRDLHAKRRFL